MRVRKPRRPSYFNASDLRESVGSERDAFRIWKLPALVDVGGTGRFREELAELGLAGLVAAGLQRSPMFSRVRRDANRIEILGVRTEVVAAATNPENHEVVKRLLRSLLPFAVSLAPCYEYVSLSPSNQLIHPARVFSVARSRQAIGKNRGFYSDWDDDASELLLALHKETKAVRVGLGLERRFHRTLWDGTVRHTPRSLTRVHRSALALAELTLPVRHTPLGAQLDYRHRFFEEDIGEGLTYMVAMGERAGIAMPRAREICDWYWALPG